MSTTPTDLYKSVEQDNEIPPHERVRMLLNTAITKLERAQQAHKEGDVVGRGELMGDVVTIIGFLQAALDKDQGGEIADNLDALYDYMTRRLGAFYLDQSLDSLVEVGKLLEDMREAWDGVAEQMKDQ
ncbi:flagellar export chaperone FliS [Aestuariirhabdus litorea]|uniref:Flagellar secretion chaperone FliS n=1 Tax=Aestuariirhabdus litorea TaxID=2528527 RepID=A0A3P3VQU9_9GAMM|nr:flagellar export chaperone FliS [Aestuariirhabdus litorea]RRJ85000.1 flagellar export chaperone FliS [Aestuariirhabdus litorea]RWW98225.1 flagellar export chaperone FliS [Endozoicomonadaceae bacterium GTF-13]